jgi:NAD(P)H dehydrogenase (quinone)
MRILITGASGNFGRRTVRSLTDRLPADDLVLLSRTPDKLAEFARAGCEVRQGSFEEPRAIEEAARGTSKMLLISGHKVGYRVEQHSNAIDAARRAGVGHVVYTSFYGSTAENTALVCIDHHGTERKLAESGMAWTALRNGMYADSIVDAAFPAAVRSGRWITSAGEGKVSLIDRDDCVACAVAVLTTDGHENRVYDVTGELWSFPEMAQLASEISGVPIELVPVSDEALYAHLDAMGIPRGAQKEFDVDGYEWCSDDMVSYEREVRSGRFAIASDDVRALIGRDPKPFRAFATEHAERLRRIAAGENATLVRPA